MVEFVIVNLTFYFFIKIQFNSSLPFKWIPTHHALFQPGLLCTLCLVHGYFLPGLIAFPTCINEIYNIKK